MMWLIDENLYIVFFSLRFQVGLRGTIDTVGELNESHFDVRKGWKPGGQESECPPLTFLWFIKIHTEISGD